MTQRAGLVVLVEDEPTKGKDLEQKLRATLKPTFEVERLEIEEAEKVPGTYEDRIAKILRHKSYRDLTLIVTDRDISKSKRFPGLSETVVSKVAGLLAVPVGVYASGKPDTVLERQKSGGDGRIILDPRDYKAMSRRVGVLASGFVELHERVQLISGSKTQLKKYRGPASVLSELLNAPEVVDHLTLYTRGDQRMIAELMPLRSKKSASVASQDVKRIAVALGTWLYDSVLRFPGVILDRVAAGSFLGIEPGALQQDDVKKVFKDALYEGPFSEPGEPRWWRHRLVQLQETSGARDGRGLVKTKTGKSVKPCVCAVDRKSPAGFVCVVSGDPVCESHSVGQISWLPRGADLARVRRDLFEELGPWIGMS